MHSSIYFFWARSCISSRKENTLKTKTKCTFRQSINSFSSGLPLSSGGSFCKDSGSSLVDENLWYLLVVWALSGLSLAVNTRKSYCGKSHIIREVFKHCVEIPFLSLTWWRLCKRAHRVSWVDKTAREGFLYGRNVQSIFFRCYSVVTNVVHNNSILFLFA